MRNTSITIGIFSIAIIVSMINVPFTIGGDHHDGIMEKSNFSNRGFKPIPDTNARIEGVGSLIDDLLYKRWCERTFKNGSSIHKAYKNVAFNIEYTPEPNKTDFWQTPIETDRLKKGDCEDIVFHFFSQLPSNQKNAEIVWGWAIDNQTLVGRAHVWYQLTDKKGKKYIVEGFSKDWNGIIPIEILQLTETRKPILTISHCLINKLSGVLPKVDDWQKCQAPIDLFATTDFIKHVSAGQSFPKEASIQHHLANHEFIEYPTNMQDNYWLYTQVLSHSHGLTMAPNVNKEITNILEKLHTVFTRYEGQKKESRVHSNL